MDISIKNLKFVHITKTSGTYIENLGLKKQIKWGIYDLRYLGKRHGINGPSWHDALFLREQYINNPTITTFTIVRNPYDRIVSECFCKWNNKGGHNIKSISDFNKKIYTCITKPFIYNSHFNGHWCPQYYYTHNNDSHPIIDYIIKYEDIEPFNDLMKLYNIDITYIPNKNKKNKFNVKDISKENIYLINKIYHHDFELLGYNKIF